MNVLITGAAGNLGGFLARHMLEGPHTLKLMIHQRELPDDLARHPNVEVIRADLRTPASLGPACRGTDCIVHFAGILFAPRPERFLPVTNTEYAGSLIEQAVAAGVKKFILVSFPHVEGESTPERPTMGRLDGSPGSVHARTRLAAEKRLFAASENSQMKAVALRPGMIYGQGVLMIEAAHWLMKRRLLGIWRKPTWIHLLSLPDFLQAVVAAIEQEDTSGVYNLGDQAPLTLQAFLDRTAEHWKTRRPWRAPGGLFFLAAGLVEAYAAIFRTASPLTRDFIRIGMASYVSDTTRMKAELLPSLKYPTYEQGIAIM